MTIPDDTWKLIGDAREYYSTLSFNDFKEMDESDRATWLAITEAIESEIRLAKLTLDNVENQGEDSDRPN